jgi:DNA-binding IclR family transcriptional regulator
MLERSIVEVAQPSLTALSAATGETINLAVPGALGVEHIAQVDSTHFLGAGQWLGRSVDYEHSANGKVFLAFGRAPARPQRLVSEEELGRVRTRGFATAIDELEPGLAAMAAPVRGARGDVIAALSISGPTLRLTPERIDELQPVLTTEARTLGHRLGHHEEGDKAA